jgi:sarcosine oxidase subunit alpha
MSEINSTTIPVKQAIGRLPAHPSHKVNLSQAFTFFFNDQSYEAYAGDTIASALWAAGEKMLSRSFKYHRPRGLFALTSGDTNTLVRVDDEPNVRASVRQVRPGMVVSSQNSWPSLKTDVMSLTSLGSRFMPVGFYYKTFTYPRALWPTYERVLRHAAGLGHVTGDVPDTYYDKEYLFADVVVVGGGPAGMTAALSAAETGARVLVLDENPYLGGHLAYERHKTTLDAGQQLPAFKLADHMARQLHDHPNIQVCLDTTAFGVYHHVWIGAVQRQTRLLKIRGKALVIANGAFEQPLLFENSDIPGVMLSSAAQRLMHLYGVKPGQRAVIISANRDGLRAALDLDAAGVKVAAVVELRDEPDNDLRGELVTAGIPLYKDRIVVEARGSASVNGVLLAQAKKQTPMTAGGITPVKGTESFIRCDLIITATGWIPATGLLYQAHSKLRYNNQRAEFLPTQLPPTVFAAGRVNGSHTHQTEILEGKTTGLDAAAAAGFGQGASESLVQELSALRQSEPKRTSPLIYVPGGKHQFVSFDEDVTIKDLRDAVAEGFDSMELLKRYSTVGMGPSQGKYESMNTMAICAAANRQSIEETGTTTSRPPYTSVPLGVLAGRMMEPVKYTPMHQWHVDNKASMMNAGLWKRPEHYGNPVAEVLTTRNKIGLIDVSTLGKIQLRGPDVPLLLNMLYTNRWRKMKPGRARYGIMCNEEGIVSEDGVVARLDDDTWYLTATTGGVNATYENILWNLQAGWDFKVHVYNMTDTYAAMNLTGPLARELLQPLADLDLSNKELPYMTARQGNVAGVPAIILRIGFTGELGYELHVPAGYAPYLWQTLLEAGRPHGIAPFGVEAQRIMRLEKGHFIIGQDTDGLTDPMMADLDWTIKLGKADFVGKPSLVRIKNRGVTSKLVGYQMLDPDIVPEEANQIVVPNPAWPIGLEIIGRVTSARFSPTLRQSIGLCWLPIDRCEPGNEFTVRIRGKLHRGQVVPLPFYDPEGVRLHS